MYHHYVAISIYVDLNNSDNQKVHPKDALAHENKPLIRDLVRGDRRNFYTSSLPWERMTFVTVIQPRRYEYN